jgi:hypothetical protein
VLVFYSSVYPIFFDRGNEEFDLQFIERVHDINRIETSIDKEFLDLNSSVPHSFD